MKYCGNCGNVLKQEDKFCGCCGHKNGTSKEELTSQEVAGQEELASAIPSDQTIPIVPENPAVENYQEPLREREHKEKTWLPIVIVIGFFGLLITVLVIAAFVLAVRIRETGEDRGNVAVRIEYEPDEEIDMIIEGEEIEYPMIDNLEGEIDDTPVEEFEEEESGVEESETEESELAIMEEFLGTWLWFIDEVDTGVAPEEFYLYYFDEDGTGVRGIDDLRENFSWGVTADGILKIDVAGWFLVEEWNFSIDNYVLSIVSRQVSAMEYSYVRVATEGMDKFVGRWTWDGDETWYYIFEADGYGSRSGFVGGREHFAWLVTVGGGLAIATDGEGVEMWSYEIDDEELTLTSRQVTGMEFSYIRGD